MTWASHLAHPVVGCRLVEVRSKIPFEYLETPLSWQIHQVCHSYISYQGSIKWSLQTSTCSLDCPGSAHWIFYMTKFMTLRPSNSIFPYSWLLIIHLTKFIPNFISHSLVPFFIFKMCFFASNSNLKKKKRWLHSQPLEAVKEPVKPQEVIRKVSPEAKAAKTKTVSPETTKHENKETRSDLVSQQRKKRIFFTSYGRSRFVWWFVYVFCWLMMVCCTICIHLLYDMILIIT